MAQSVLYSPQVLALATGLAAFPHDPAAPLLGEARSPTCGSSVKLSLALDESHRIAAVGVRATACAIGQASAMLFASGAGDRTAEELAAAERQIESWLTGGALPDWPGFDALEPARAYPARHGAIRLPWKAALAALASGDVPR
jgi:NifU-like protein involved in Fe-S cluster formation